MKELLIPTSETLTITRERRRRYRWIAVARMMIERRRSSRFNVVFSGFKTVVHSLLFNRLIVELRRWWRWWCIHWLRMRATSQ